MHQIFPDKEYLDRLSANRKTIVFLDSARLSSNNGHFSYLFLDPITTITAKKHQNVDKLLKRVDNYLKNNWICGYLSYEASYALEKSFFSLQKPKTGGLPLGWFGIFDEPWIFDHHLGAWNKPLPDCKNSVLINEKIANKLTIGHLLDKSDFYHTFDKIKNAIKNGETYQVNYTYDVRVQTELPPYSLYRYLREKQKTPYCSFIQNEYGFVASFSPELFIRKEGRYITTKPMKGTARRGYSAMEDRKQIQFLKNDTKNCAENLMIVDLIRNDLGKICEPGTVITNKLFDVETHPTLHQMTSDVTGILKKSINFSDIIKNIFPCGSVTGAPKIRTMKIIHDLEKGERGVYCGTIGYLSPKGSGVFNIPIRTLQKTTHEKDWRYRVGSGIIWDSTAEDEWRECAQKTSFLEYETPDFDIIETMLFDGEILYLPEHLKRMQASAEYFEYPCSIQKLQRSIVKIIKELDKSNRYKIRLLLSKNGHISWEKQIVPDTEPASNKLLLADMPVNEKDTFLFHKTTHRPWYNRTMEDIKKGLCYDRVFFNSRNEITEGAISTIFIEQRGILYTPPVICGLLPGTLRSHLLDRGSCYEKILFKEDLYSAGKVFCGNSVRGLVEVILE